MLNKIKKIIKSTLPHHKLCKSVSGLMPPVVCVDIGAAHFPHGKWLPFLFSPETHWIAIEPDRSSMDYINSWDWPCRLFYEEIGLSKDGGFQTLYETNSKTGSSLLKPSIPNSMKIRKLGRESYYFPYKEKQIETKKLTDLLSKHAAKENIFLKLDIQGAELSILKSAIDLFDKGCILGIETECSLLAEPIMQGSGKCWQIFELLESYKFECLEINPYYSGSSLIQKKKNVKTHLNEADIVFALKRSEIAKLNIKSKFAMFGFYLSYKLYEEAILLIDEFDDIRRTLINKSIDVNRFRKDLLSKV